MRSNAEPLVSIVTPVYNTEKYLAECIESVLAQTYQNWQYVIVNNCSTDRSLEIAQQYAQQDSRIQIHDNREFLSQMQNWNHTMKQVSKESKYCKVVHADDWLFPECIQQMVQLAETHPSVGLVGAYRLDEDEVNLDGLPYPSTLIPGHQLGKRVLLNGGLYIFGSPTSLLIRSDLILKRDKFYNEASIHADQEVCFDLLQEADFGFVHQVLTYTRRHNETTTTFIRRFETYRLGNLTVLQKYGPIFLEPDVYQKRLNNRLNKYYTFLAGKLFEIKEKEFWVYHKNELYKLGYRLSWLKLMRAAFWQALNLEITVRKVGHALKTKNKKRNVPINVKKTDVVTLRQADS